MSTNDDLIKDILTKMFYDTRSTLNENKNKLILEECISTSIKFDNYNPETGEMQKGKPRSIKYPELGTWGDGSCKCKGECLEFKKECCGKRTTSVDSVEKQVEVDLKSDMSYNGSTLKVPTTSKIQRIESCSNYYNTNKDKWKSSSIDYICNVLKDTNMLQPYGFENTEQCVATYKMSVLMTNCKDGAIKTFEYNGDKYTPCFQYTEKQGPQTAILRPEKIVFLGYFTGPAVPGKSCGSIPYNPSNINPKVSKDSATSKSATGEESSDKKTSSDDTGGESTFFVQF